MKQSKRFRSSSEKVEPKKTYSIIEAVSLVKTTATAKFIESVDIAIRLGVDIKKADQALRGTVALPHGIGKAVKVLVIAKSPKDTEAKEAGADFYGYQEYLDKIKEGWTGVDVIIATPDTMVELGKLGKILGPRGLMPNPKSGTVTNDIAKTVKEVKAGKIEFRTDKAGIVHSSIGKVNFEPEKLVENLKTFLSTIVRMKPQTSKGQYIKSVSLSSTMGPAILIDNAEAH
ncbi:MAG: 50S ribosomal protein L1 [Ignavibacteria bacterium]|nr:50S ribosomal protein L1 [Bacteroidota bacterium]MSQ46164.1 50S ribosomal protein L1 [Ignavibacteria bacterium]